MSTDMFIAHEFHPRPCYCEWQEAKQNHEMCDKPALEERMRSSKASVFSENPLKNFLVVVLWFLRAWKQPSGKNKNLNDHRMFQQSKNTMWAKEISYNTL